MSWTERGREVSLPPNKMEQIGDSEENTHEDEEREDEDDDDDDDADAESCIIGNGDDMDDDENQESISWRMWCLLGQEGAWADEERPRRSADDDVLRRSHLSPAINEAEKNRLFWEACLADESSMTPIF